MATIPHGLRYSRSGMLQVVWEGMAATDTGEAVAVNQSRSLAGAVQFSGTFGGVATLQHSNDGVTWYTVTDRDGTAIAVTAAALHNFSTAAKYLRAIAAAGVVDVEVLVILRG